MAGNLQSVSSLLVINSQGPVVQSIISLTSSLVIKMLTSLVSTISNSQVFLLKCKSYSHFFGKNVSVYAIFYHQSFNDLLTSLVLNNWAQVSIK